MEGSKRCVTCARNANHHTDGIGWYWHASLHAQGHTHDDDAGALEAEMETVRGTQGVLADIMRHFPPAEFIEILGSTCHTAVASAASATGECRHKVRI